MDEDRSRLTAGLYVDQEGRLIIKMAEFLAAHGIEDSPLARRAVLSEILQQFGKVPFREEE
jgi:hypothetical protein